MARLPGYKCRKRFPINGSDAGEQSDYQMLLTVHRGRGTDSPNVVYLNDRSRYDFNDIRFTKSDGLSELDHWRQEYTDAKYYTITETESDSTFYPYIHPQAIYVSGQAKTFIVFQGKSGTVYQAKACHYDHSTHQFSGVVLVSDGLNGDTHGAPSIAIDGSGYIYVFYGSHNSAQKYRKSSNTYDISSWGAEQSIAGNWTYPNVFWFNSKLYMFARYQYTYDSDEQVEYVTSSNGVDWSGRTKITNITGTYGTMYPVVKVGASKIHCAWLRADHSTNTRRNVYYIYSTDGTNWKEADGTSVSLPISEATADSAEHVIRAFDSGTDQVNICDIGEDGDGNPIIAFASGTKEGTGNFKVAYWDGSSWNVYTVTSVEYVFCSNESSFRVDGSTWYFYVCKASAGSFYGQIQKWKSTNSGQDWTKVEDITSADGEYDSPKSPVNAVSELEILFHAKSPSGVEAWGETLPLGDAKATFWIEFDNIPLSPDSAHYYIYYGKPDADSGSNGANTFPFFDDFSSDTLATYTPSGTVAYDALGKCIDLGQDLDGDLSYFYKGSHSTVRTFGKINLLSSFVEGWCSVQAGLIKDGDNFIISGIQRGTSRVAVPRTDSMIAGGGDYAAGTTGTPSWSTWYRFRVARNGTAVKAKVWKVGDSEPAWQHEGALSSDIGNAGIGAFSTEKATKVDELIVANYCDPEPTWGTWESEECIAGAGGSNAAKLIGAGLL